MNEFSPAITEKSDISFWYGIPHGYLQIDLAPSLEQIENLVEQVLDLPNELREQAEELLRFYSGVITALNANNVRGCAIGLHRDDVGGFASSTLTISTVPTPGVNAKLILSSMAGTAYGAQEGGVRPMRLPCGIGFLAEEKRHTVAPGRPPEGGVAPLEGTIWQGAVAVTGSGTPDIIVIQLVTSAVHLADDYRNVLLGVAHTLTFTDPSLPRARDDTKDLDPTSAIATIRNDFG
ncbi:hypothetical protein [Streptomyces sp. NPDC051569]|uniref:hypothetical protein n=1 Tax=Streptomyces sp. NPDC051569 TaxID=3365661 RepID=UPI00379658AD